MKRRMARAVLLFSLALVVSPVTYGWAGDSAPTPGGAPLTLEDLSRTLQAIPKDPETRARMLEWIRAEEERLESEVQDLSKNLKDLEAGLSVEGAPEEGDGSLSIEVRSILAENCFECHGPDAGQRKAGLRLDDGRGIFAESRSGKVPVVANDPSASELYRRITTSDPSDRMPPPESEKELNQEQIETIREWIESGAVWPQHWAFVPPRKSSVPAVERSDWPRNEIDRFILGRLELEKIAPSPEGDRATLIRRLSFDLVGLPPTPAEVDAFLHDSTEGAYERLVDRLLASPHYGEKWARWWLDLAAYGDSDGHLSDFLRPWAFQYRDWVVEALNADMPFDRFTIEQIAGDLLPDTTISQKIATGFLRNTLSNREGGADLEEFRVRQVADRAIAVGAVWMGLTLECAQCHDHKYDPLSQKEFYSLYGFFNSADEVNIQAPLEDEWERYQRIKPDYDRKRRELFDPVRGEIEALQVEWERRLLEAAKNPGAGDYRWDRAWEVLGLVWGQNQGEGQLEGTVIVQTPVEERTPDERDRLQDYFLRNGSLVNEEKFKELAVADIVKRLDELEKELPKVSRAQTLRKSRDPRPSRVHLRGDFRSPGEEVFPTVPAVLKSSESNPPADRLGLARWLVAPDHPLTSRVVVNRLWQELFGRGIVLTSEDFGVRGSSPSHPELLDWLAVELTDRGWSLKEIVKLIVCSATYRQSSESRPDLDEKDPSNTLLARQSRRRLPAELVRDAALSVAGLLSDKVGGPSVRPPQPASVTDEGFDNKWEVSAGEDRYRRGLYTFLQRTSPFGQSVTFDLPNINRPCTRRERSNTPLQALNLLNDPVFFEAARGLARRVESYALSQFRRGRETSFEDCIDYGVRLCLARPPSDLERARFKSYLEDQVTILRGEPDSVSKLLGVEVASDDMVESAAWVGLASVLLNLDEFIMRE